MANNEGVIVEGEKVNAQNFPSSFFVKIPMDLRFIKKQMVKFYISSALDRMSTLTFELPILTNNQVYFIGNLSAVVVFPTSVFGESFFVTTIFPLAVRLISILNLAGEVWVMADILITRADLQTPPKDGANVGPCQSPISAMINSCKIYLNDTCVNPDGGNFR